MPITIRYINLDKRLDRRQFFEEQVRRLGLDCRRISAVTPNDIGADELTVFCSEGDGIRPVEFACIRSHLAMMDDFLSSGEQFGAFCEDDAMLSESLPQFLSDYDDLALDRRRDLSAHGSPGSVEPQSDRRCGAKMRQG
jgi:GR25 family glycosyltransferase involved in LPS biosynthesis